MSAEHWKRRTNILRTLAWIFLYLAVVGTAFYHLFSTWGYDDPFITYRYAEHLAQGQGFVYNLGERVLSTTTPLFAIILAIIKRLSPWIEIQRTAVLIGAFSLPVGGILIWELGRILKKPWIGGAGLLLYPTFRLVTGTISSETPLYLALCLTALVLYKRNRYTLFALVSAFAVLTRPDGILILLVVGIDYLLARRRSLNGKMFIPWIVPAVVFCLILLAWAFWAWSYFGSPVPVTLSAKQHQGQMAISQQFAEGFLPIMRAYFQGWPYWIEALLALVGIGYGLVFARSVLLVPLWMLVYFVAYSLLGVTRYFWYYAPLSPGFVVLVGAGLSLLPALSGSHKQDYQEDSSTGRGLSRQFYKILSILAWLALLGMAAWQVRHLLQMRLRADPRVEIYRQVGEWLRANTPEDVSIGALEVGVIGYYSQRRMIDFAGLIQPDITAQLTPNTNYEDAALWALEKYHPDFVVLHQGLFPRLETLVKEQCSFRMGFEGLAPNMDIYDCQGR